MVYYDGHSELVFREQWTVRIGFIFIFANCDQVYNMYLLVSQTNRRP